MSNSPLVSYTRLSPNNSGQRKHVIDTVTIHCVVGQCSVEALGDLFARESTQASANYGIGADGRVGLYVSEDCRSWCSSNAENDDRAVTIECASDAYHPYAVNDVVFASLINLLTDICRRNGIKKLLWKGDPSLIGQVDRQNMTVHRWFDAKACPGDYLYNRHGEIAAAVNARLEPKEDENAELKKFNEMFKGAMTAYRNELRDNDSGTWSKEAREWAASTGLIVGSGKLPDGQPNYMWEDFLTREQTVMLLFRFAKKYNLVRVS